MVITFDFTSRTKKQRSPLACALDWNYADVPDDIRQIDIHRDYAPMCLGNFDEGLRFNAAFGDDGANLSEDVALCLAVVTLFRPEHKEMVYEWACGHVTKLDLDVIRTQLDDDLDTLFRLNSHLVTGKFVAGPHEQAFHELCETLEMIQSWY